MHQGLPYCNPVESLWLPGNIHSTGGEILAHHNSGNDIIQSGHDFQFLLRQNGSAIYQTVDFRKQAKSEILDGQEQSTIAMSNVTFASGEASLSSGNRGDGGGSIVQESTATTGQPAKKKRNLPGTPDPDADVIALSPNALLATNRFVCEICNKGFQRDQNLQLHRRGHNLPWKLKQRTSKEIRKKVYTCPEPSCVHHDPKRALGDLTGIKKHFCRKHGEKKWKCEKCSKRYAVQADWKAHSKTCGTREYRCDCGTLFSRRDSFVTHRAFCDALAEENSKFLTGASGSQQPLPNHTNTMDRSQHGLLMATSPIEAAIGIGGNIQDRHASGESYIGIPGNTSKISFEENGISLLAPKWDESNRSSSGTPGTVPKLNLWLGRGPGPGPPGNKHLNGGPQQLQAGGSSFLNPVDNGGRNGGAIAGLLASSQFEGQKTLPGLMPFGTASSISTFCGDILGSEVGTLSGRAGPSFGQSERIVGMSMSGLRDFGGVTDWTSPGKSMLSSTGVASSPVSMNVNNCGTLSSIFNQPSAQMSATALLQKAAQMGATASSPSLFRGFGMACPDSSSSGILGSAWAGLGTDQGGRGGLHDVSSFMQPYPQTRSSGGLPSGNFKSANFGGIKTTNDNESLHELMNSLSGSSGLFANVPQIGDLGSLEEMIELQRNVQTRQTSHQISSGGTQPALLGASLPTARSNFVRTEDGHSDKLTRDFLGMGGPSSMARATKNVGETVSQRDLATITSLGSRTHLEPLSNQIDDARFVGVYSNSWKRS